MDYFLQTKLIEDKKFKNYLSKNSQYIKYLNRDSLFYKQFIKKMKELYQERTTDKLNDAINTIDIVSSILNNLK